MCTHADVADATAMTAIAEDAKAAAASTETTADADVISIMRAPVKPG